MSLHDIVKIQILNSCKTLGFQVDTEYSGKDWRADVFVNANGINMPLRFK